MNNASRVYKWLHIILFILTTLLGLQATYIVIIGGSADFFWFSIGFICLLILSNCSSSIKKPIATLIVLSLALYFIVVQNFIVLAGLLLSYIICFFYPKFPHHQTFKIMALFTVLIFFYSNQHIYFKQLKDQYKSHDSGESWQQSGAL